MSAELGVQIPTDHVVSMLARTDGDICYTNAVVENEMLFNIVRGDAASSRIPSKISNGYYNDSSSSNTSLPVQRYTPADLQKCELLTNLGEHDGSFAISTRHVTCDVAYNEVELNINHDDDNDDGCRFTKTFSTDPTSVSLYDSHINVSITKNDGPFCSTDERFSATFDSCGDYSNYHTFQKAINSRFGNTNNEDVLKVQEDHCFNTQHALGQNQ